jgi:hypothetical protein
MARQIKPTEEYKGKLLKLIPSEIVAAYMVLQGMIPEDKGKWGSVIVTLVLLIITPFYLRKLEKVKETFQIIGSSLTFVVWVYSLGGPFLYWNLHEPWIASIVLVLWTLIIPLLFKTQPVEE